MEKEDKPKNIDKQTWGEILTIIGGFILAETAIRTFVNLTTEAKISPWVLPAFAFAIIIGGVELKNDIVQKFGGYIYWAFITISILLIALVKSQKISDISFLWFIFIISLISIGSWLIQWIFLKKKKK
jgi:hypothetical protein